MLVTQSNPRRAVSQFTTTVSHSGYFFSYIFVYQWRDAVQYGYRVLTVLLTLTFPFQFLLQTSAHLIQNDGNIFQVTQHFSDSFSSDCFELLFFKRKAFIVWCIFDDVTGMTAAHFRFLFCPIASLISKHEENWMLLFFNYFMSHYIMHLF